MRNLCECRCRVWASDLAGLPRAKGLTAVAGAHRPVELGQFGRLGATVSSVDLGLQAVGASRGPAVGG